MKILYIGSVCAQDVFDHTVKNSKKKSSSSAQNFEMALIKGFISQENVEMTIASCESIAPFPSGSRLLLRRRKDLLFGDVCSEIIPSINIPIAKQIIHGIGANRIIKQWLKDNPEKDKCVFLYGLYPTVAEKALKACKTHDCKVFLMLTDLPATMFTYSKDNSRAKKVLGDIYRKKSIKLQGGFDGYIYLTEEMSTCVAPAKPYIVIETIADISVFDSLEGTNNEGEQAVTALMYAGALNKKYGIDTIITAFEKVKTDCELWLFGSGDYENEIIDKEKNNQKIHYGGTLTRSEILTKETQASLLINLRNKNEEFTRYSFPSKMVEYMLSGTPMLTSMLDGIPEDYYQYVYSVDSEEPEVISEKIDEILGDREKMKKMGIKAKDYVMKYKNAASQSGKIVRFLEEICE